MVSGKRLPVEAARPRKRVRFFLRLVQLTDWLPEKLTAAHLAIWLGLLDGNDLNDVTASSYGLSSGFASENHNFFGLWPWEESVVKRIFPGCRSLLVAAAGGGREVIALANDGLEITAFDSSALLTAACRANIADSKVEATILDSKPDSVPEGLGMYDGLIIGRGSYHHISGRGKRIRFLQECKEHLTLNAPVFLEDFLTLPTDHSGYKRTASIAGFVRRIRRSQEPIEIGDVLKPFCFYHFFQRHEIEAELREAGFQLELFAASPADGDSNIAHAVARASDPT